MRRPLGLLAAFLLASTTVHAGARLADRSATSADGVKIHYLVGGAGSPALVFIHCWSCDSGYWREQLAVFARTHRVAALDLAGHGASGDQREHFTMAGFGADVAAVITKEKLDHVVLIGHSMGGPVALEAARLLAGKVELVVGVDNMQNVEEEWPTEEFNRLRDAMKADFRAATDGFVRTMFLADADPALVERIAGDMAAAPPRVGISALDEIRGFREAEAMAAAGVPVICINSTTYPTAVEVNRRHAKSFDVVLIDHVGHFIQLEKPHEFNEALARVLAERAAAVSR